MNVIEVLNPEKCVGICDNIRIDKDPIKTDGHLGTFSPKALVEWATKLMMMQENEDKPVEVYLHHSSAVDATGLCASENGDNPYVVVISWKDI